MFVDIGNIVLKLKYDMFVIQEYPPYEGEVIGYCKVALNGFHGLRTFTFKKETCIIERVSASFNGQTPSQLVFDFGDPFCHGMYICSVNTRRFFGRRFNVF